jgi:hypothetical protein
MLKRDISDSDYIANIPSELLFLNCRDLKNVFFISKIGLIDHLKLFLTANLKTKSS